MRPLAAMCAVLLVPVLAACGEESSAPERTGAAWRTEHLAGEVSVDFPTLLVSDDDDALVLMLSDDGVLQSQVSRDGASFEAGEPLDLGEGYGVLGDVVRLDDGTWFALGSAGSEKVRGDEEPTYRPLALRSDDGLTWERTSVTGFADAVEINDLEVVAGRIFAVGDYRTLADPGQGGFEARAWTSVDGRSFEEARLPGVRPYQDYDDESYAGHVVSVGDDLLASGRVGRSAALWRSDDAGATWSTVSTPALKGAYAVAGLRADGSTVVATVSADTQAIRSGDGGRTWEPVRSLPARQEADGWAPRWSGAGRFFTLTGIDDESWSRPEVCYADIDQCGYDQQPAPRLVGSTDGSSWTAIALPNGQEASAIAGTHDGRLLAMVEDEGGVAVLTWPAGTELPVAPEPARPETVALVTLAEGDRPEVGMRYNAPMFVHCGMEWLWFGGATWQRTDGGPGVETGAGQDAPDGWPLAAGQQTLYGYATVRADGVLEYSLEDGTVIATYERRSGAPGCD